MKRLLVLTLCVVAFAAKSFAGQGVVVEKLNDKKTFNRVARYLSVDSDQSQDLKYVFNLADKRYKEAIKGGASEEEAATKAMNFTLANSKVVLSKEQYSKLLQVINTTVFHHEASNLLAQNR
ncbi:hypothetical protein [Dysgonomonas sp. 25]|uniref:hypothetical protein n=1 Tax=Dysgonomonas sp. 25 TaxID=2302933 RepID=UPI0013CFAD36|nr:hypothetical protein [Dysgonomonas sp. 25]NDV69780.1 hypothetical protein [Dysgonomonas sp. 25]